MDKINGIIYIIINLINGKQYVGQTTRDINVRISEHKRKKNYVLGKSIKKYGIENFKWISFSCPEEDLDWTEIFLIKELNTLVPNGYNLEMGGYTNKHLSREIKRKISISTSGKNHHFWGKKRPEHSQKMKGNNNPFFGKGYLRIGEKNFSSKPVLLISPIGEKFELPCYVPFCAEHNLDASNMAKVLNGKYKQYKGWTGHYLKRTV